MKYKDFSMEQDGFVGHMAEPEGEVKQAVIVIMGGEKSLLPGIKIAERFADYGMIGLSVSLYGAEGIADGVNLIPLDMLEKAVQYLREERHICSISTYGMSMGSIFAALAAKYIGGIDNVILVSPSHVPFEGSADKKNMTGHSMITWRGEEIPFVKVDFGVRKAGKYFYDADEAWPSDYSVQYMKEKLDGVDYAKEYKAIIYPNASHLLGMMPNKERNKWLYRMIPVIGLMYRSLWKHKAECLRALDESEKEIIKWIKGSSCSFSTILFYHKPVRSCFIL